VIARYGWRRVVATLSWGVLAALGRRLGSLGGVPLAGGLSGP